MSATRCSTPTVSTNTRLGAVLSLLSGLTPSQSFSVTPVWPPSPSGDICQVVTVPTTHLPPFWRAILQQGNALRKAYRGLYMVL